MSRGLDLGANELITTIELKNCVRLTLSTKNSQTEGVYNLDNEELTGSESKQT